MSTYDDQASNWAHQASGRHGEEEKTDAIGEGLAAVAFAVLDLAEAVRELAAQQQERSRR